MKARKVRWYHFALYRIFFKLLTPIYLESPDTIRGEIRIFEDMLAKALALEEKKKPNLYVLKPRSALKTMED